MGFKVMKSEEEWKDKLSPEAYRVLREKGTERAFTGEYTDLNEKGTYVCRACNWPLFTSTQKFDSHCGWPSFFEEMQGAEIKRLLDKSHGMIRTEIVCSNCGSHLGHVFNDGPQPSGERYCVNSISMKFIPETE